MDHRDRRAGHGWRSRFARNGIVPALLIALTVSACQPSANPRANTVPSSPAQDAETGGIAAPTAGSEVGQSVVDVTVPTLPATAPSASSAPAAAPEPSTPAKSATTVSVSVPKNPLRYGDKSTFQIAVAAAVPGTDLSGTVTVSGPAGPVATGATDPAGRAALPFQNTVDPGDTAYSVNYGGNPAADTSQGQFVVSTTKTDVKISIPKILLTTGSGTTLTISVSGTPRAPTGTAAVTLDGKVLANGKLDAKGRIRATISNVAEGGHTLKVKYNGDVRFDANSASASFTVRTPVADAALGGPNPCPATAHACVDLAKQRTWLQTGGKVTYGPVPITSGRPGYRTPAGTFRVFWHHKDHKSSLYDNAPMPNSVFFNGGIAFHAGSLSETSHGCIHLSWSASQTYYDTLRTGDSVYVFGRAP